MLEISFLHIFILLTAVWILIRTVCMIRDHRVDLAYEAKLLMVYVCLLVIARIVYFPWNHGSARIGKLIFDPKRLIPPNVNLIPLVHLGNVYNGWEMNLIGNVLMFIPVGIIWPVCFPKLNSMGKTVLAGFALSLFIEVSQLLFYQRCSDVDDVLLNTCGVMIGALVYFGLKKHRKKAP